MNSYISDQLLDHEHILWQGQPGRRLLTASDIFLIPFSLLWCGFAIFWEAGVLASGIFLFGIWGIPFVLVGLYMVFGRFIYKKYLLEHMYYYVTNKRIIILKRTRKESTTDLYYRGIPSVEKRIRQNGKGTLRFGDSPGIYGIYENTGLDLFMGRGMSRNVSPAFFDIEDASKVYRLVQEQMVMAEDSRR